MDAGRRAAPSASGWQPTVMLHEITHNLGGVAAAAPHYTADWPLLGRRRRHVLRRRPAGSQPYDDDVCPLGSGAIPQTYDCGHDDYFNPDPAAGSYLATHWNVYNSAFIGACTQLGMACGDEVVPTAPVNTTLPTVAGTGAARDGAHGQRRDVAEPPDDLPPAMAARRRRGLGRHRRASTWSSYVAPAPTSAPAVRVVVAAGNEDGSAIIASAPTAPVSDGRAVPGEAQAARRVGR